MNGSGSDILNAVAVLLAAVVTIAVGIYGGRRSRTTSDFLVASRSVGSRSNATAITGEYLSAASFLGVAGYVAKFGADALWYPVGFTAGYLGLLMFVAAPLRRSGAYTVPDFAEFRLSSARARRAAMLVVVAICVLYLIPQFQGAGLALQILLGIPAWVGAVGVGLIVIINVVSGGMRSITFVQAIQYWLKLTAIAIPALVLLAAFAGDRSDPGEHAPPRMRAATTVDITLDVKVTITDPTGITADGQVDGVAVHASALTPGAHTLGEGTTLTLDKGAATPVVTGAPVTGADWLSSGRGLGGGHPVPYVTRRHRMTTPDGDVARKQITQTYYGTTDLHTQLLWETVNGVDQRPIDLGAWLVLPELERAEHYPVVVPEYLSALAERWYGDSDLTTMLTLANTIAGNRIDDDLVEPGNIVIRPGFNKTHAVRGETLRTLCTEHYGTGMVDTWIAIVAAANGLTDPDHLVSGRRITLPS